MPSINTIILKAEYYHFTYFILYSSHIFIIQRFVTYQYATQPWLKSLTRNSCILLYEYINMFLNCPLLILKRQCKKYCCIMLTNVEKICNNTDFCLIIRFF